MNNPNNANDQSTLNNSSNNNNFVSLLEENIAKPFKDFLEPLDRLVSNDNSVRVDG